jgi:hypothetical protein
MATTTTQHPYKNMHHLYGPSPHLHLYCPATQEIPKKPKSYFFVLTYAASLTLTPHLSRSQSKRRLNTPITWSCLYRNSNIHERQTSPLCSSSSNTGLQGLQPHFLFLFCCIDTTILNLTTQTSTLNFYLNNILLSKTQSVQQISHFVSTKVNILCVCLSLSGTWQNKVKLDF